MSMPSGGRLVRVFATVSAGITLVAGLTLPTAASTAAQTAAVPGVWERVAPGASGDPVVVTAVSNQYTDAFVRVGTSLLHQRYGIAGSTTEDLGGILQSDPGATSGLDFNWVFAVGADDAVWYRVLWDGGAGPWTTLGGIAHGKPSATRDPYGVMHVFAVGADDGVWTRRYELMADNTSGWTPWESIGGIVTSDLAVSAAGSCCPSPGYSLVEVVARGLDGAAWIARRVNANAWTRFETLGGAMIGNPALFSDTRVAAVGVDRQVYLFDLQNGGWFPTGGYIRGDPTLTYVYVPWGMAVLGRGAHSRLWIERWDPGRSGWSVVESNVTSRIAATSLSATAACNDQCSGLRIYANGADGALYTILL
jgi:hypothetical protein